MQRRNVSGGRVLFRQPCLGPRTHVVHLDRRQSSPSRLGDPATSAAKADQGGVGNALLKQRDQKFREGCIMRVPRIPHDVKVFDCA